MTSTFHKKNWSKFLYRSCYHKINHYRYQVTFKKYEIPVGTIIFFRTKQVKSKIAPNAYTIYFNKMKVLRNTRFILYGLVKKYLDLVYPFWVKTFDGKKISSNIYGCKWTWEKFILHYNSDYTWVINIYNDIMKISCLLQFLFTFQFNMCRNTYQPIRRYTDNVSETERN